MAKGKRKDLQTEVAESAHKIWLAGLGALAVAEEEGTKLFKNLMEKGEQFEERRKAQVKKAESAAKKAKGQVEDAWGKLEDSFDSSVAAVLGRLGVPTRDEIAKLTKRVEELTASVEKLAPKTSSTAKK